MKLNVNAVHHWCGGSTYGTIIAERANGNVTFAPADGSKPYSIRKARLDAANNADYNRAIANSVADKARVAKATATQRELTAAEQQSVSLHTTAAAAKNLSAADRKRLSQLIDRNNNALAAEALLRNTVEQFVLTIDGERIPFNNTGKLPTGFVLKHEGHTFGPLYQKIGKDTAPAFVHGAKCRDKVLRGTTVWLELSDARSIAGRFGLTVEVF